MRHLYIAFSIFLSTPLWAQNPAPTNTNTGTIVFTNADIHVGNGTVYSKGTIVVQAKKIIAIGNNVATSNYPNSKTIDVAGKSIYPGIISPNNILGLLEIESSRPTSDFSEIGMFNPNVRSFTSFNTDSEIIPTVRCNGVLISQATPIGGIISGRSSIFNLDGWNYEDAVLKKDDGLWITWPSKTTNNFDFNSFRREKKKNENYASQVQELYAYFSMAQTERNNTSVSKQNLKYAAIESCYRTDTRLYIVFEGDKEALDALEFIQKYAIKFPVLVGAPGSDLVINAIKTNNIPVLIPTTHRLPERDDQDIWDAYKLPARLFSKGLLVGMFYNESHWRTRNLPFSAGNAAGHGLTKAQALQMVTLNNAKILGIDSQVGSLEVGKLATFVISQGDLLDMANSKVEKAYINGAEVNLDDKQKRLAKKYEDKYNLK
ncbi:MAG: amidohydrolase family protein [Leadbetterella sp.]